MVEESRAEAARSPVASTAGPAEDAVEPGIALCLSGGGYRAMLFHVGALWRLNELAFLPRLSRVSSVSGGSITAATLGLAWGRLDLSPDGVARAFDAEVVAPVRALAGRTVDQASIVGGALLPGSIADRVTEAYRDHLFGAATLQDLPDSPRFVLNATNVQTGALWRFSKPYMGDYTIGLVPHPDVEVAVAVAASSAFPPVLSPLRLEVDGGRYDPATRGPLHRQPFTTDVVLSDGGVYDNLGLETAWKRYRTVLVSDAGGQLAPEDEPKGDWLRHSYRVNFLLDHQVRNLRKRQVLAGFATGDRKGTYWGIRSDAADYGTVPGALPAPQGQTMALAQVKTRLKRLEPEVQERLVNWGYAICDVAMRRWVDPAAPAPGGFPYPEAGLG